MKEPESWVRWVQIEGTVSRDRYLDEGAGRVGWDGFKLKGLCHETDIWMKEPESWVGWVQIEGTVSRDRYLDEGAGELGGMGSN
jgi:hypothetical protein